MAPLWQPLLWAVLIGSLVAPLNVRLSDRLGGRPQLAASLTLLGVLLLFLLPLLALAGAVAAQAAQLLKRLDAQGLQLGTEIDLARVPMLARPLRWIDATAGISLEQMQDWFVTGTKRLLEVVASSGGAVMLGALGTVVSFILMLFVLFFVLRDGSRLRAESRAVAADRASPAQPALGSPDRMTRAVFMGIGLTAIVQGALLGVGFFFAGVPSPARFRRARRCCLRWCR